jgi:hypothetical protein
MSNFGYGASDFFQLAQFCRDIVSRLRNLNSVYEYIKGEAGVLLMAFENLHGCLQQFQGIPREHLETLHNIRSNCHRTLTNVSSAISKFEALGNTGSLKKGAKKTLMALQNQETEFRDEIQRQITVVQPLVLYMNQYVVVLLNIQRRQSRRT